MTEEQQLQRWLKAERMLFAVGKISREELTMLHRGDAFIQRRDGGWGIWKQQRGGVLDYWEFDRQLTGGGNDTATDGMG